MLAVEHIQVEPARRQHPAEVTVAERQHRPVDRPRERDHPVGPAPDVGAGLAARRPVPPDRPAGPLGADLGGGAALVVPVVPLAQVLDDVGRGVPAGTPCAATAAAGW